MLGAAPGQDQEVLLQPRDDVPNPGLLKKKKKYNSKNKLLLKFVLFGRRV